MIKTADNDPILGGIGRAEPGSADWTDMQIALAERRGDVDDGPRPHSLGPSVPLPGRSIELGSVNTGPLESRPRFVLPTFGSPQSLEVSGARQKSGGGTEFLDSMVGRCVPLDRSPYGYFLSVLAEAVDSQGRIPTSPDQVCAYRLRILAENYDYGNQGGVDRYLLVSTRDLAKQIHAVAFRALQSVTSRDFAEISTHVLDEVGKAALNMGVEVSKLKWNGAQEFHGGLLY